MSLTTSCERSSRVAVRLTLAGRVQGIGLRPAVARFAHQLSLAGHIANTPAGVTIHVEGPSDAVAKFENELFANLPSAAEVSSRHAIHLTPTGCQGFSLRDAGELGADASEIGDEMPMVAKLSARVPPDVAVCADCLAEVQSSSNRRHGYPLTSCTACGPRYTIIERMPYEREQTSMSGFRLCKHCRDEYQSPADRRFHAQTNACSACGPQIWLRDAHDRVVAGHATAIQAAAAALRQGCIVALRGLGGYQLLVDATSNDAVERLRERKQRQGKPLAVMVPALAVAEKLARLDDNERRMLQHAAGPIVVCDGRTNSPLAPSISSELRTVGIMLPTTPLHGLLLNATQLSLVCTSGNVEGDPLVYERREAFSQLRGVADLWLEHDRPIHRPIDDSVVRLIAGRPAMIRLARGFAPWSLDVAAEQPRIALGGHQKTALAVSNGAQAVLGPHLGDLESLASRQRFAAHTAEFASLYGAAADRLVCDQHPGYFTTEWAANEARDIIQVQHHHAHIVAGMLEYGWLDRQVLGVAFDGTGWGTDGTIWGGEFLLATATSFERVAHLRPLALPGGERAIREPWRVAVSLVEAAAGEAQAARLCFRMGDAQSLLPILPKRRFSPVTTSAGRLFDGVAALVLGIERCAFEGQAAMLLEAACDLSAPGQYEMAFTDDSIRQLDWRPLVKQILRDRSSGASPGEMATRFHRSLAGAVAQICQRSSPMPVVLGGGVFQNRVLVEMLVERFAAAGQPLGLPGLIPVNDGGLAAGQLAVATALAAPRRTRSCA